MDLSILQQFISQLMYEEGFIDIKIAGALPIGYKMAIGVSKEEPYLRNILQKAIQNFPVDKKETIEQRWLSIVVSQKQDFTLVYMVLAVALLFLSAFFYRQILLKKLNRRLEALAHFDTLTKLPNRSLFYDRLHKTINGAKDDNKQFALFFIDLDRFKQINDSLGHHIGDEVLKIISQRLLVVVKKKFTIARLSGDEFTIIMESENVEKDATSLVKEILEVCTQTISISGETLYLSASVGISIYPQDAHEANDLVKFADTAMYKAKKRAKIVISFTQKSLQN
ncbi:MAG: GGDEF domain-containing protein [Sulfurimonas sp.]|nr:GGDEF domain-containing protein [Sulfurimonas sp.]